MTTLTTPELRGIRNAIERKAVSVRWTKAAIHDAAQAVEDRLASSASVISSDIDAATSSHGLTLTVQEKKLLVAMVLRAKYGRDIL